MKSTTPRLLALLLAVSLVLSSGMLAFADGTTEGDGSSVTVGTGETAAGTSGENGTPDENDPSNGTDASGGAETPGEVETPGQEEPPSDTETPGETVIPQEVQALIDRISALPAAEDVLHGVWTGDMAQLLADVQSLISGFDTIGVEGQALVPAGLAAKLAGLKELAGLAGSINTLDNGPAATEYENLFANGSANYYDTFEDAIDDIAKGDRDDIYLRYDYILTEQDNVIHVPGDRDITITFYMNGHTITVGEDFNQYPVHNEGTLTLAGDGTINNSSGSTVGVIQNSGTMTINGSITYRGPEDPDVDVIENTGTLQINGGDFSGDGTVVENTGTGTVEIHGGVFSGGGTVVENTGTGTVQIYGGSFSGDVKDYVAAGCALLVTNEGDTPYTVGEFSDDDALRIMDQQTVYKVTNGDVAIYYRTQQEADAAAKEIKDNGGTADVTTVTHPSTSSSSSSSSSSSQKTPYQEERPFWDRVVNRIEDAEAGDTVKANAESCTLVPFDVLDALRGKDVTLVITSRTTPDIVIHGEDVLSTDGVLYYSMKELYNLYKDLAAQEEEAPAGSSTINPETGGILEVTFSDVVPQAAAPAAEMPAAPAEAPLVDEPAQNPADTVISAQADPAEGASALPAQEASFPVVPVLVAAAALAVAGALGFVWYRQR